MELNHITLGIHQLGQLFLIKTTLPLVILLSYIICSLFILAVKNKNNCLYSLSLVHFDLLSLITTVLLLGKFILLSDKKLTHCKFYAFPTSSKSSKVHLISSKILYPSPCAHSQGPTVSVTPDAQTGSCHLLLNSAAENLQSEKLPSS